MSKSKSSKKSSRRVAQEVAAPEADVVVEAEAVAENADTKLTEAQRLQAIKKLMKPDEFKLYEQARKKENERLMRAKVKEVADAMLFGEDGKFYAEYTKATEICAAIEEKADIAAKKLLGVPLEK